MGKIPKISECISNKIQNLNCILLKLNGFICFCIGTLHMYRVFVVCKIWHILSQDLLYNSIIESRMTLKFSFQDRHIASLPYNELECVGFCTFWT
jgi:hypothetical protein